MALRSEAAVSKLADQRKLVAIEDVLRQPNSLAAFARTARSMFEVLPNRWRALALLLALTATEVATQVVIALVGRSALDAALSGAGGSPTRLALAALGLIALLVVVVTWRHRYQEVIAFAWRERCALRTGRHIAVAPYEDLAAVPMAGLREILMTDGPLLTRYFIETTAQLAIVTLWGIAAVGGLIWIAPQFLPALAIILLMLAGGVALALKKQLSLSDERFRRLASLSQKARDVTEIERIMMDRQFGLGDRSLATFEAAHAHYGITAIRLAGMSALVKAAILTINAFGFICVILFGGWLIVSGELGPASLLAALFVISQLLAAVAAMGDLAGRSAEAMTAAKRMEAYWHVSPVAARAPVCAGDRAERLDVHDVTFGYGSGEPVLAHVDLSLQRGLTALTAATGSGKTTLALLAAGYLQPAQGSAVIQPGDIDVRYAAQGRILYVGPRPILVAGSIRDNLFIDEDMSPNTAPIWRALSRNRKELDFDAQVVGVEGTGLSTGQAQLVQLARAVQRDPEILILDEATGALDMETEKMLQEALLAWCKARICLVISHRNCPWLQEADRHLKW